MNSDRLHRLIIAELTSDILKSEQELERVINSNTETDKKISDIKRLLGQMITLESSLSKFISMWDGGPEKEN
jgi:hypothetical protein